MCEYYEGYADETSRKNTSSRKHCLHVTVEVEGTSMMGENASLASVVYLILTFDYKGNWLTPVDGFSGICIICN